MSVPPLNCLVRHTNMRPLSKPVIAVLPSLLLALATAFSSTVQATPLDELRTAPVSMVEFGSFKLEVALTGIKDWPFPIEGASVSYKIDPDQVEIVVAVRKVPAESFRTACARTDRKSTRLNSSHANISYAVFCLKKK